MEDITQLALKKVKIKGNVIGKFAAFEVEQIFKNETHKLLEVSYNFPIVETATVTGFEIEVGDKKLKGVCKEKGEAREEYQRNLVKGNSAYLMEQNAGNVFNVMIGKIKKGEEVKVKITYIDELEILDDNIHLLIPTLVAPKYKSKITEFLHYSPKVEYTVDFDITVDKGVAYESIECTTHTMKIAKKANGTSIQIENYELDRDCKIKIALAKETVSSGMYKKDIEGKDVVYLSFMPEIEDSYEDEEKEYNFIVDISGSMNGTKMEETKKALIECLSFLDEGDKFNIIPFNGNYEFFKEEAVAYDSKTYAEAKAYIEKLEAYGGTEILKPLKFALYEQDVNKTIILFTDGEVGNEEEILSFVKQNSQKARVFTFGIGANVNSAFIRGLARSGKGKGELIAPKENIHDKIVRTFARIQSPILEDLRIDYGKNKLLDEIKEDESLFNYEFFNVCARVEELVDDITLVGNILEKEYKWTITKEEMQEADFDLGKVYAKLQINKLELYLRNWRNNQNYDGYKKMIIEYATKYGVNSKYTSFITVNEREQKEFDVPEYQETVLNIPADYSARVYGAAPSIQMAAQPMMQKQTSRQSAFRPRASVARTPVEGMATAYCEAHRLVEDEKVNINDIYDEMAEILKEYYAKNLASKENDILFNIIYFMFKDARIQSGALDEGNDLDKYLEAHKEAVMENEDIQTFLVYLYQVWNVLFVKKYLKGIFVKRAVLGIKPSVEFTLNKTLVQYMNDYKDDKTALDDDINDITMEVLEHNRRIY